MGKYLIGIDEGTTGCKTCIFDFEGNLIAYDYREYPCYYPKPGWVEQTDEDITPALYDSCKSAIAQSGVDKNDIVAVGISSQGSVIGLLDKDGKLLRPFVGWQDIRAGQKEIDWITSQISREDYYALTGDPLGSIFSIAKLVWLRENEPDNWEKTKIFSTNQDYFLKAFGAEGYWTDLSSASREGTADVNNNKWDENMHKILGISMDQRAVVVPGPGKVVGKIPKHVAEKTGLAEGTLLCMGAHDQNCNTFGAGAIDDGTCVMVMGTFGSSFVVSEKPIRDPYAKLVVKGNHGVGNFTIEAFSTTSASSYRWYRDTFCDLEVAAGKLLKKNTYNLINSQIESVPPGANGVTFLPYLQGASGARLNNNARGTFIGMTLGSSKADMARAVMEGICFEMNDILLAEAKAGIDIKNIRLTGGAANSPLWSQMCADIYQKPILLLHSPETGCLGAALYAGVGAGIYKDCREAAKVVKIVKEYEPNKDNFPAYEQAFKKFTDTYEALDGKVF